MNQHYLAISRKFRPKTFGQVIGQDSSVISLQNALKLDRISHAYLFSGTRGCGKTTLARLFAKALTCPKRKEGFDPCNSCDRCRAIDQSRSMDVVEIDGASHRGIDDIRQLRESAGYSAGQGNWKIYIIDEVHMLTKEAFNALLKTLEEPPNRVVFLMATTEAHRVPLTIQSRCQRFVLSLIDVDLIESRLRDIVTQSAVKAEDEALALIAAAAEGSVRDAETLLDQVLCLSDESLSAAHVQRALGLVDGNWFFKLDSCVQSKRIGQIFTLAKELLSGGIDLNNVCSQLTKHFRNHLLMQIFKSGESTREMLQLPRALAKAYEERADQYSQEQCLAILDLIKQHQLSFKSSAHSRVHLEMMLIAIVKSSDLISWSSLYKRLDHIQNMIESPSQISQAIIQEPKQEPKASTPEPNSPEPGHQSILKKSALPHCNEPKKPLESDVGLQIPTTHQGNQSDAVQSGSLKGPAAFPLLPARRDTLLHFARVEFGGQIDIE